MEPNLPPIVKDAERLMKEIAEAAAGFPQLYRYSYGQRAVDLALKVAERATRAWMEPATRPRRISKLKVAVVRLKLLLKLGAELRVFKSQGQFKTIFKQALDVSRQVTAWERNHKHPKGQNAQRDIAPEQRAKTLSTRAASNREAN